ncbi:MAG: bifunctional ADP-heptose synthase [Bacteroidales bacterium]|nr:bifunctional ADP-heptose synthase [Bacteroidales bacterium]MDD4528316.1 bifunctional ADP-heptose synthase [Bacteroidales bacterium]
MDYKKIFNKFNDLNILIIGDVMIDSYMWGKVERISPEAPVPIATITKTEDRLGGAANVALNIRAMGANPILCSVVGSDTKSKLLISLMSKLGMDKEGICFSKERETTVKTRILGNKIQMLRVDQEISTPLSENDEKNFIEKINNIISTKHIDAIVFQDYDKGVITQNVITEIVKLANKKNIPTTVDPKKRNFLAYKNVTLYKPNLKELKEGLKIDFDLPSMDNLVDASNLLQQKLKSSMIFITLSEYGVFIADYKLNKNNMVIIPAHKRAISDVSGAGDTVISVATLCIAIDLPFKSIAEISNLAGGIVCEQVGVVPIDKNLLLSEVYNKL